jgi:type III restriction enzyme
VSISLFPFQTEAAAQLSEAADEWVQAYADTGVRKLGLTPIPFLGHLKAVTGAGKTPVLAKAIGDIGPAVVLWTSVSAAVVDQTYRNLRGRYKSLLPPGTQVVRERPSKGEWENLLQAHKGLTIWVTTVGSWNEAEAAAAGGKEDARLNMHRPQPDWGGDKSPWAQLASDALHRPIWVVYDESHNQTPAQLDQLVGLKPVGFLLASATPPSSALFDQFAATIAGDPQMQPIAEKGRVRVSTKDVVEAQLLKQAIEVENFDSDPDVLLDEVVRRHRGLVRRATKESASVNPKTVYIVEHSNPRKAKGEIISRPQSIWEFLRAKKIAADEIAVYTQTKALPDDAERISSLTDLQDRHVHIICNRALQEGWDDPEAYVEYFDDESNSFVRIKQIIGRALRQPGAQHYDDAALNTAYLYVRVPSKTFDGIVEGLKKELALYGTDDDDPAGSSAIKIKTKKQPLAEIPVKRAAKKLSLPNYQLGEADLDEQIKLIKSMSKKPWDEDELIAKGLRTLKKIDLTSGDDDVRYRSIAAATRRLNGEYLARRIQAGNRHCIHLIDPDAFTGPAFEQRSSAGSLAQTALAERAAGVIDQFERSVQLVVNKIKGEETWSIPAHSPGSDDYLAVKNAAHAKYSLRGFTNDDEKEFALVLDALGAGTWFHNPPRPPGYGVQLPVKVGTSNTFYPDFLWWVGNSVYALDPTGAHILNEKVRGKLLTLDEPKIALFTRGRVAKDFTGVENEEGWTMTRPIKGIAPRPEYFATIREALTKLAKDAGAKAK